jgi:hypothetical protein
MSSGRKMMRKNGKERLQISLLSRDHAGYLLLPDLRRVQKRIPRAAMDQ